MNIRLFQHADEASFAELHTLLPDLNQLINDAFARQDRSIYGPTNIFPSKRIKSPDQVVHELGTTGVAAIAFASPSPPNGTGPADSAPPQPIAMACLKPWKGKLIRSAPREGQDATQTDDLKSTEEITLGPNDWEVSLCVSKPDPAFRGKGLVTACLDVLLRNLQADREARRRAGELGTGGMGEGAGEREPQQQQPLTLWVTVLEGVGNVEYWQRRGFERYGPVDDAPVGTWMSLAPFRIGTLRKVVA